MQVWTNVKMINKDEKRFGQAGVVMKAATGEAPDQVTVRWDVDLVEEPVALADLQQLS